jgi:hypothetical protein
VPRLAVPSSASGTSVPVSKYLLPGDSGIWFDSDAIIYRGPNPLLAAKVSLSCLNRDMSQQKLNLFQFPAKCMAQARARPSQVMRGQFWHTDPVRAILHYVPNRLFRHVVSGHHGLSKRPESAFAYFANSTSFGMFHAKVDSIP